MTDFDGRDEGEGGDPMTVSPLVAPPPLMSPEEHAALARAPKLTDRPGWGLVKDIAGKVWNAPNTALGLLYGGAGMAAGEVGHLLGLQKKAPGVQWRNNALQFTNNPLGGVGALTLGNTTTWVGDPYDPTDSRWFENGQPAREPGTRHTYPEHETPHTYQGQQLGPLYLPSNIAGGVMGLLFDRDKDGHPNWHGPHNWNEAGPQSDPPRPWK
jgi:hypothetical protein